MDVINDIRNLNWYCHGIPERCLVLRGRRMNICARCFGANIGHAGALGLFIIGVLPAWWVGLALLAVMMVDWSAQEFLGLMSNNVRRVITGILGGLGTGILIWGCVGFIYRFITSII